MGASDTGEKEGENRKVNPYPLPITVDIYHKDGQAQNSKPQHNECDANTFWHM
jgi:hypothetical protein